MGKEHNVGLYVGETIAFNDKSKTRQVKFNGEDIGTVVIDRETKRATFRSTTITIDGLYRIAEWCRDGLAKRINAMSRKQGDKNVYTLYMKTINAEKDLNIKQIAEFLYKNKQIEDLPF